MRYSPTVASTPTSTAPATLHRMTTEPITVEDAVDRLRRRHAAEGLDMPGGCDRSAIDALEAAVAGIAAVPARLPLDYRRLLELVDPDGLRVTGDVELVGPQAVIDQLDRANPDLPALLIPVGGEGYFVVLELATDGHPGGLWVWDPGLDDIHRIAGGPAGLIAATADAPAVALPDAGHVWVALDVDGLFDEQVGWERTAWPDRWLLSDGVDPADLASRHTPTATIAEVLAGDGEGLVHARVRVHAGTAAGSVVRLFAPDAPEVSAEQAAIDHLAGMLAEERDAAVARLEELTELMSSGGAASLPVDDLLAMSAEIKALTGMGAAGSVPSYRLVWWPRDTGPAGPTRDSVVELVLRPGAPADGAGMPLGTEVVEATVVSARHVRDADGVG